MNKKLAVCLVLLATLVGCTAPAIDELERSQAANLQQRLEKQSLRIEMQEEYLGQLVKSQQAMMDTLETFSHQLAQIKAQVSPGSMPVKGARAKSKRPAVEMLDAVITAEKKEIIGRREWVWVELLNRNLKARVDTGARSSALSAVNLLPFERNGQEWIRFRVPDEEHPDGGDIYEAPLVKYVRIRQPTGKLERRPVIELVVRLGELVDTLEFSLTNRENRQSPLLLGRNFLRDVALVDVAQEFTQPKYIPQTSSLQIIQ